MPGFGTLCVLVAFSGYIHLLFHHCLQCCFFTAIKTLYCISIDSYKFDTMAMAILFYNCCTIYYYNTICKHNYCIDYTFINQCKMSSLCMFLAAVSVGVAIMSHSSLFYTLEYLCLGMQLQE